MDKEIGKVGLPTATQRMGWSQALERLVVYVTAAARLSTIFGGLMIVGVGFLICIEIILRKVANTTTGVSDELSTYVLAFSSALAFSYCLVERAHIRIDSAARFLPIKLRTIADLLALACLTGFFAVVAWYGAETAWISFVRGSRAVTELQTPLFIPQGLWAAGLAIFVPGRRDHFHCRFKPFSAR